MRRTHAGRQNASESIKNERDRIQDVVHHQGSFGGPSNNDLAGNLGLENKHDFMLKQDILPQTANNLS